MATAPVEKDTFELPEDASYPFQFRFFTPANRDKAPSIATDSNTIKLYDFKSESPVTSGIKDIIEWAPTVFQHSHPEVEKYDIVAWHDTALEKEKEFFQLIGDTETGQYVVMEVCSECYAWSDLVGYFLKAMEIWGPPYISERYDFGTEWRKISNRGFAPA